MGTAYLLLALAMVAYTLQVVAYTVHKFNIYFNSQQLTTTAPEKCAQLARPSRRKESWIKLDAPLHHRFGSSQAQHLSKPDPTAQAPAGSKQLYLCNAASHYSNLDIITPR